MTQEGINTVNGIATYAANKGIAHLSTSNKTLDGNLLEINGNSLVNFGSCSYLGLEFHPKLKRGAINAIEEFGTQFSSSRAYLSLGMYEVLEKRLDEIFQGHTIVAPTTTLGHIAAIPILVGSNDLIILDHQVHNSVQTAVSLLKSSGVAVELLRHNRMDLLEDKIRLNSSKYEKIWYMADGVYSMYGDKAPIHEIENLLDKYKKFNFYVDDAHAMSCYGERGQGFVLSEIKLHERMVVATSLNKAFASGGGALIFPNREMAQKVKNCGGPLITSGPMQPSALGAALAAADIHLSTEMKFLQTKLKENIKYTDLLLKKYGLPNLAESDSAIFFVAVGLPKVGYNLINRLMLEGYYLNLGIFPAVPIKNTGVRFTITRLHTFEQIEAMIKSMAFHFNEALIEEDYSIELINKAFKIKSKNEINCEEEIESILIKDELTITNVQTIIDVNKEEWNQHLGKTGILNWNNMNLLENSFKENVAESENWDFEYISIKDSSGTAVLQTFLTTGIMKDDMMSPSEISADIERIRLDDPNFYTSRFLSLGSMITEGNHLFFNEQHPLAKKALAMLFSKIEQLQSKYEAATLMIRDLPADKPDFDDVMVDNGYFKTEMPENYKVELSDWNCQEPFISTLSKRSKRHFKENVIKFEDSFHVKIVQNPSESQLKKYVELYTNVQNKSLEINTFPLPFKFFQNLAKNDCWEIIELSLKNLNNNEPVGVVFACKGNTDFNGVIVGLDYEWNYSHNVYRQAIYQLINRAKSLNYNTVNFGFSAGIEKKKFGAIGHATCAYMQVKDNFKFEALMSDSLGKEVRNASSHTH